MIRLRGQVAYLDASVKANTNIIENDNIKLEKYILQTTCELFMKYSVNKQ